MATDVIGSYLALNQFLEPRGYEIVPEGDLLKVMDKKRRRAVFVADLIDEVSDWVYEMFDERILVEAE